MHTTTEPQSDSGRTPRLSSKTLRLPRSRSLRAALTATLLTVLSPDASANVLGSDAQNFNSTTSGLDFVTVHSSETLKPGIFNFGFFLNYAVNTLPYQENNVNQSRINFNDSLLGADFNFGVGIMQGWDFGVSFPQILSQSVDTDTGARGQFARNGLTEIRLNTKVRLLGDDSGGFAIVGSMNLNQTDDNPFTGSGAGPTFNIEGVVDHTFGDVNAAVNFGYRVRQPGDPVPPLGDPNGIGIEPFDDQIIASGAVSYLFREWDTKIIGEVFGSWPAQSTTSNIDRQQSSLEALLGLKHDFNPNLSGHVGGGTEIFEGNASPDWRVYVGLNYSFGPIFSRESDIQRDPIEVRAGAKQVQDGDDPFAGLPKSEIETFVVRDILFKFDSDELEDSSREKLANLARYLMKPPTFEKLEIAGHTDSIGRAGYNLDLSQRRARNVKRILVESHRLPAAKIVASGYGESVPIADNGNYQGRALNRRVEFRITRDFNQEASKSPPPEQVTPDPNDPGFRPPRKGPQRKKPTVTPPKAKTKAGTQKRRPNADNEADPETGEGTNQATSVPATEKSSVPSNN